MTYAWNFGDGSSGTGATMSHVYTTAGSYTATLTVNDGNGGTDNETVVIAVRATNRSPIIVLSVTPTGGRAPLAVAFDARASSDPDGDALTFAWNFGDGGSGTGPMVNHLYTTAGNYSATLTVNDGNGATVTETVTLLVTAANRPPTAVVSATPTTGTAPLSVTFDGRASTDPDGNTLTYAWNFGDGSSGTGGLATHVYTAAGTFTATLTVNDGNGGTDNETIIISVTPASYTITASAGAGGTITPSGAVSVVPGASQTFAISPSTGYEISSVLVDGVSAGVVGSYTFVSVSAPHTISASFAAITLDTIYQINCGGSAAASYSADQYYSGGTAYTVTNTITLPSLAANPAPQAVYKAERYGNMTYTFPNLTAGLQYTVRLHFAELYFTASGKRKFNVSINGSEVLTNFDLYALTGARYAAEIMRLTTTANSSGQIVITFTSVVDNAKINGIEIIETIPNAAPTIATPAAAASNPVTTSATVLSVLGADDNGEANLSYTWELDDVAPAVVNFSGNGTNAAKTTTATFTKAGIYPLLVRVFDGYLSATSTLTVTVDQTLTSVVVSPSTASIQTSGTQQFTATARDQFGTALVTQPAIVWSASGGSISGSGLYTAGAAAGSASVTAASGTVTGTASVTITPVTFTITASAGTGGSISPSGAVSVVRGASQTFTITPSTGYRISGVLVDGTSVGTVNSYTFSAVAAAHTVSASFTATTMPASYQINCGSSAASPFTADQYYTGGTAYSVTSTIVTTGITNPAPQAVYKTERYGAMTYTLPGLTSGSPYKIRLHFAELYWTASGKRKFNVAINGTAVLSDYDIYASTGARYKAEVKEFTAAANGSGQIVIAFVNGTDNAKVNGIEIFETVTNAAPTIATAAAAAPNPVAAATAVLSVLGADDNGEANLTYTWATTGTAPAAVTFNANGTNAAKTATATFTKAGSYTFQATARDQGNLTVASSVAVTVGQTLTGIVVSPSAVSIIVSSTQQFTATARDQFGAALAAQPVIIWSATGGSIDQTGLFTAGATAGIVTITATSGSFSGTAAVTIVVQDLAPTIETAAAASPNPVIAATTALSALGADDNGEANLTYTWATTGTVPAAVVFSANGTNAAKATTATFARAGSYGLQVTVKDQSNLTVTSPVSVTVGQTVTTVTLTPAGASVQTGAAQQFTAAVADQFGTPIASPSVTWSVSGGGTISTAGLFTAGSMAGGPYTVTAMSGAISGTTQVTVTLASTGFVVYGDQLATGYGNYSWGGTYNLNDAAPVKVGSKSLSITYTAGWGGLQLQKNSGTQTHTGFTSYSFWAHGGASGTRQCQFYTRTSAGQESNHVNVDIPSGTWTRITVTLSALGNPADAKTIVLQDRSGSVNVEFNIDQLELN